MINNNEIIYKMETIIEYLKEIIEKTKEDLM